MKHSQAVNRARIKFLLLVLVLIIFLYFGKGWVDSTAVVLERIKPSLESIPFPVSGAIFIALYAVVTFFVWFSKDLFRFAGALIFGLYGSTLLILIAEAVNAVVLFYFSRFLGRDYVRESFKKRYTGLEKRVGKANFLWLLLFRGVPLFPFRFLDLAAGLTTISLQRYILAVILGSPLRIFWQQYAYTVFKDAVFNPVIFAEQLNNNPQAAMPLFVSSFVYVILIIVVVVKLKRKG